MARNLNHRIARFIVQAQAASDVGKGIPVYYTRNDRYMDDPRRWGYSMKGYYIQRALASINAYRSTSNFKFYVCQGPDQNGYDSIITYFRFKNLTNEGRTIAYHLPVEDAKTRGVYRFLRYSWCEYLKNCPLYDSSEACKELVTMYKL